MYTRLITTLLAIFSILCLSHVAWLQPVSANQQAAAPYQVSAVTTDIKSNGLTMTLSGNAAPAYTVSERFDPYRLVVDIAEAQFDNRIDVENILPENSITKLNLSWLKDQQPTIARFEFAIDDNSTYDVQRVDNDLQIQLLASTAPANQGSPEASQKIPVATAVPQDNAAATIFEAPTKDIDLLKPQDGSIESEMERLKDSFSFSGYKNERISVDFYKIDLHNVFRLFRQISDLNIIVDESVNGSITLALNDVPWDFALDIILNLADLKKEERYNTIVIYPNSKEFFWPEQAMDNLSFEADTEVVQEEALIIQQSTSQPVEIMQAKELLIKAMDLEKKEDFEEAAELYEKAFKLWPDNGKIASKLANLYLGRLQG
ncbi:MAG: secretin and TonB N-terminal domain-containing protein, partial [Deltaproteobacteria bacterium]|nr:secretin and TonB N-terminal domain-containing protein [Deltaproteobacteria bacterium]